MIILQEKKKMIMIHKYNKKYKFINKTQYKLITVENSYFI